MEKQKAVADASVVAKWFLNEEFSEEARLLRDSFVKDELAISVPSLLFYETLNALRYTGLYNFEELASAARSLSKYGFDVWEPRSRIYEETAKMSLQYDISVYDAAYVALASYLGTTLYTADLELVQKAPEYSKHVKDLMA
ncbi:MAG: type II toxin-antitoxin system VapC family toxin [Candidatus Bathyarchaeota archaeon]|nr:type II toxin-antitoxin system VapC family toxin [Candidatus Bathyarchaeota archaeon]